jgi:hypothetical protein
VGQFDGAYRVGLQAKKEIKRLTARIVKFAKDVETLQAECEGLRAQQRTHTISLRQSKDASRRVYLSNQASSRMQASYDAEVSAHAAVQRELALVRAELVSQQEDAGEARLLIQSLQAQLEQARNEIAHGKVKIQQETKLNRFVRKHVRAESLQGKIGGNSNSNGNANGNGAGMRGVARRERGGDAADATNTNTNANNTSFRQMLREANTKQHQRSAVQATEIALDERAVNSVINDLRAACVFRAPDVLPYLRTLTDRLTEERAQWKRIAYR